MQRFTISAVLLLAIATGAHAREDFVYDDKPIHPGCIHALVMVQGDRVPVTTSVSLDGCQQSERAKAKVQYRSQDLAVIEDEVLLGGGTFGYRLLNRFDNGVYGVVIQRVEADGTERVSLAAIQVKDRPMVRHGTIVHMRQMELLGEIWIPGMELTSFRSAGNRVHFTAGVGRERVDREFDFTRLGKMRK